MCGPVRISRDYRTSYERISGPTSIIEVRAAMEDLAKDMDKGVVSPKYAAKMIRSLAEATKRKPAVSRAPKRIAPLSPEERIRVRAAHKAEPHLSQLELANRFGTNPGRISEALNEVT